MAFSKGFKTVFVELSTYVSFVSLLTIEIHKNNIDISRVTNKQYSSYKAVWQIPTLIIIAWKKMFIAQN